MPPDARLVDAPHLQALREPTPPLNLVPRHILQPSVPLGLGARLRASAGLGGGAVLVHVAIGAAFFALLSFRDPDVPREVEIPVEVVTEPPKPAAAAPKAETGQAGAQRGTRPSGSTGPAGSEAAKPDPAKAGPAKPDMGKVEPTKPDTSKPDTSKPDTSKPMTAGSEPVASEPRMYIYIYM